MSSIKPLLGWFKKDGKEQFYLEKKWEPILSLVLVVGFFMLGVIAFSQDFIFPRLSENTQEQSSLEVVLFPQNIMYFLDAAFEKEFPFEYQACLKLSNGIELGEITKIIIPPASKEVTLVGKEGYLNSIKTQNIPCIGYDGTIHSHPTGDAEPSTIDLQYFKDEKISCVHYSLGEEPRCYSYGRQIAVVAT